VIRQDARDLTEPRRRVALDSVEDLRELAEEPRPAEAAASDDHPVAAGGAHHAQRVPRFPHVAVAEHRDPTAAFSSPIAAQSASPA
jgi:hypothetical protein